MITIMMMITMRMFDNEDDCHDDDDNSDDCHHQFSDGDPANDTMECCEVCMLHMMSID